MFTGIIEKLGIFQSLKKTKEGKWEAVFFNDAITPQLTLGESIAVDGVCLSVVKKEQDLFFVHLSHHTLEKTLFGSYQPARKVNLERSLLLHDRLSGHIVQGHVDGLSSVINIQEQEDSFFFQFSIPKGLHRLLSLKGSIAVNGISLTLAEIDPQSFFVAVIPITMQKTNLSELELGSQVHIETDLFARYLDARMTSLKTFGQGH